MEKPNLNYIDEIYLGNELFKYKFFSLLKEVLPQKTKVYQDNFKAVKFI